MYGQKLFKGVVSSIILKMVRIEQKILHSLKGLMSSKSYLILLWSVLLILKANYLPCAILTRAVLPESQADFQINTLRFFECAEPRTKSNWLELSSSLVLGSNSGENVLAFFCLHFSLGYAIFIFISIDYNLGPGGFKKVDLSSIWPINITFAV